MALNFPIRRRLRILTPGGDGPADGREKNTRKTEESV